MSMPEPPWLHLWDVSFVTGCNFFFHFTWVFVRKGPESDCYFLKAVTIWAPPSFPSSSPLHLRTDDTAWLTRTSQALTIVCILKVHIPLLHDPELANIDSLQSVTVPSLMINWWLELLFPPHRNAADIYNKTKHYCLKSEIRLFSEQFWLDK